MNISIVNYDCGNIVSLKNALLHLGATVTITNSESELEASDKIIVPGVGAFGYAMKKLHSYDLVKKLHRVVIEKKKPTLGICLGAQVMMESSDEEIGTSGLGWIRGNVSKIPSGNVRVPHVGWDRTKFLRENPFSSTDDIQTYYYTHSYYMNVSTSDQIVGVCDYGQNLPSIFNCDHIWGCQFHPEKSQKPGLDFLSKFLQL